MRYPRYDYTTEDDLLYYQFFSIGPKGRVKKVVEYSKTNMEEVYNLAFGDWDEENSRIDDKTITNNEDSLKVLATVASTVYAFTNKYPKAWVFAAGSSLTRTRLYRIGLANNIVEISVDFLVYGLKNDVWEEFTVGQDYDAFLARRK
ncbi:hypothetical protein [uncultured Imperialibacter sp.]|uniref:DUF6934 family protein n=1 Tax=uncultured Imperialibacter sp. TaxID=1672639 RepID=UPI0030D7E5EA|tara:strand:- start:19442 stop:19882 length:441 start_codon:yes stop_codon:yes gene_type:complete